MKTDDRVSRAVAAYDAMFEVRPVPASGACAAGAVLGVSPADAFNLMVESGAVELEFYKTGVVTKNGDTGLRVVRRVPMHKVGAR